MLGENSSEARREGGMRDTQDLKGFPETKTCLEGMREFFVVPLIFRYLSSLGYSEWLFLYRDSETKGTKFSPLTY